MTHSVLEMTGQIVCQLTRQFIYTWTSLALKIQTIHPFYWLSIISMQDSAPHNLAFYFCWPINGHWLDFECLWHPCMYARHGNDGWILGRLHFHAIRTYMDATSTQNPINMSIYWSSTIKHYVLGCQNPALILRLINKLIGWILSAGVILVLWTAWKCNLPRIHPSSRYVQIISFFKFVKFKLKFIFGSIQNSELERFRISKTQMTSVGKSQIISDLSVTQVCGRNALRNAGWSLEGPADWFASPWLGTPLSRALSPDENMINTSRVGMWLKHSLRFIIYSGYVNFKFHIFSCSLIC